MKRMGRKGDAFMDQICAKKKLITIKEKNNHNAEFNSPEPRTC